MVITAATPQVELLRVPAGDLDVRTYFTGRAHGNLSVHLGEGDVGAYRVAALDLVGARAADAVFMEQVHGAGVAVVDQRDGGRGLYARTDAVPAVDALVSFALDVPLVVLAADCVPVLLADPHRAVAAVHAGRRGVEAGVVAAVLDAIGAADPSTIQAWIGPAIGGCCYEVPAAMAEQFNVVVPGAACRSRAGAPALDLPAAVAAQLIAGGVRTVVRSGGCTRCADGWFSHRGTGQDGWPAGRHAGIIVRGAASGTRADLSFADLSFPRHLRSTHPSRS